MLRGTLGGLTAGTILSLVALGALSAAFDPAPEIFPGRAASQASGGDSAPASAPPFDDVNPSVEPVRPAMPAADESSGLAAGFGDPGGASASGAADSN